jgi:lipopolysaccharide/colanic/teichoic acid biosynthesis glycosyltransferase
VVRHRPVRPGGLYAPCKRLVDLVAALVLLAGLMPLFLVVAIAIPLDSPGSPLFFQVRVGRGGRPFRIWKFRTMRRDAPRTGPELTQAGDPRITRLGRWLRRMSVDELPQLVNILLGHMSFIGPRPEVPSLVDSAWSDEDRALVLAVRPGLSGWAQIHGRDDLDIPAKLAYDRAYVRALGPGIDFKILLATPGVLLGGAGIK